MILDSIATVGYYALFAGGYNAVNQPATVVDIFDVRTHSWTTAALSQGRYDLVATALGPLALFAVKKYK
jgi:hypothetical protein